MNELTNPVNATDVVVLDLKNLSGSVQFRTTVSGELQWKASNGSTWFKICSLEILRGRSITDVTVNAQNKFVLTFSDLTTQVITISALEDAVQRAITAATQALASAATANAVATGAELSLPAQRASFSLDFVNARFLDPQISVSRNSIGTYIDKNGIMRVAQANKPRFNHSISTKSSLGVLQESRRTNYLLDSSNFTSSTWVKSLACEVQLGTKRSIYSTTVQKIVCNGQFDPRLHQEVNLTANNIVIQNNTATFSVYLWTDEPVATKATLYMYGFTGTEGLISKTVDVTQVPQKFEITKTFPADFQSTKLLVRVDAFEGETGQPASGRYMFVDCAQFEIGSFSTSYIPTTNTPVTREKDLMSVQGSLFSQYFPNGVEEGTMFCVCDKGYATNEYPSYWSFIGANTTNGQNSIRLTNLITPSTGVTTAMFVDGTPYNWFGFDVANGALIQSAYAWKKGDAKVYVNSTVSQDINVQIPTNINQLRIEDINGHIKQLMFWPVRLPNAQLQALVAGGLFGIKPNQAPTNGSLFGGAYLSPYALLRTTGKQELSIDCTGSSITRNIRRPYPFLFEIVDSSGVTITTQPSSSCVENTDNSLVITGAVGKTLTYAITPIFEY